MATTETGASSDVAVVQSLFAAFAAGDTAGFADLLHAGATWIHRNDDRFAGVHSGPEAIMAYLGESVELTAGTLRAVPASVMADGAGRVCVVTQLSATRPDGRALDDTQILLIGVDGGRARSFDQFVGDPRAVAAFWA